MPICQRYKQLRRTWVNQPLALEVMFHLLRQTASTCTSYPIRNPKQCQPSLRCPTHLRVLRHRTSNGIEPTAASVHFTKRFHSLTPNNTSGTRHGRLTLSDRHWHHYRTRMSGNLLLYSSPRNFHPSAPHHGHLKRETSQTQLDARRSYRPLAATFRIYF